MNESQKRQLVDQLAALATDPSTNAWSARVFIAAALWLERDLGSRGDNSLTIAAEHVEKRARGDEPSGFRSFVNHWFDPARYR